MPPHDEFIPRFHGQSRWRTRTRITASTLLTIALFAGAVGASSAAAQGADIGSLAREGAALTRGILTRASQSLVDVGERLPASSELASASIPLVDDAAARLYRFVCPLFSDCGEEAISPQAKLDASAPRRPIVAPATVLAPTRYPSATSSLSLSQPTPAQPAARESGMRVIERVIERERVVSGGGITEATLAGRLESLRSDLLGKIAAVAASVVSHPAPAPSNPAVAAGGNTVIYTASPSSGRIDKLDSVSITGGTVSGASITGGSVEASSISGTIVNAISSLVGTINALTATSFVATNATTTSATTTTFAVTGTATSTFSGGIEAGRQIAAPYFHATSSTATSTFAGGITGPGSFLVQSSSGRVAIGTSSPATTLHIVNTVSDSAQYIDQFADRIPYLSRRANGTPSAATAPLNGNILGGIAAGGHNGSTGFTGERARLAFFAAEDWTSSNQGAYLSLSTNPLSAGSSLSERMRIDPSGNVGIGQTSPTYKLDVTGLGRFTGLVDAANFVATSTTATTTFAGGLTVDTSDFVVDPDAGRVGIGTASPTRILDIQASAPFVNIQSTSGTNGNGIIFNNTGNVGTIGIANSVANNAFGYGEEAYALVLGSQSARSLQLGTNNAIYQTITSGGLSGFGTTTPWAKLSVTNTGTGPSFVVEDSTSPDTTPFIIDASGQVGIGTASLSSDKLTVSLDANSASAGNDAIRIQSATTPLKRFGLGYDTTLDAAYLYSNHDGVSAKSLLLNPYGGNIGIGTTTPQAILHTQVAGTGNKTGLIIGRATGNATEKLTLLWNQADLGDQAAFDVIPSSATEADIAFRARTSSALSEALRIKGSGNVGIGTTSPTALLSIARDAAVTTPSFIVGNANASGYTVAQLNRSETTRSAQLDFATNGATDWQTGVLYNGGGANSGYSIQYANGITSIGSTIPAFHITTSGNVGVGTTSPFARLSVHAAAGENSFAIGSSTATYFLVSPLGRVGIGSTSPMSALDVNGSINFSGKLYEDGVEILGSMIAPFASACPTGWTEYTAARGRAVVGTPSGGTNAGTVGSALTNLGTRTTTDVAAHTHSVDPPNTSAAVTDPGHAHTLGIQGPGGGAVAGTWVAANGNGVGEVTTTVGTGITASVNIASFTSGSTGVASVDVTMPYIQLTYCQKTAGSDIAEWIPTDQDLSKETIVSVDPHNREKAVASSREYDPAAIGIIATQPGWLLGQETTNSVQLALAGRVPVRVSLKNGEIKPGDAITTSSIPGVGMKATRAGPIVGKAMEALNETSSLTSCTDPTTGRKERCGTVLAFVNVSWYSPTVDAEGSDPSEIANSFFEPLGFDDDLAHGDIASLYYLDAPKQAQLEETEKVGRVGRADGARWKPIVGVISTEVGGEGELLRRVRENNKIVSEVRLISSGKAEMRIAPDSPDILPGDSIVLSHIVDGHGVKATTDGPTIARSLEAWSPDLHKETISVIVDSGWYEAGDTASTTALSEGDESLVERIFDRLAEHLRKWFANATNGITDFFARIGHFDEVRANKLCAGSTCIDEQQLAAILAGTAAGAATAGGSQAGAPGGSSASGDADSTLTLYGNNPVAWQQGEAWEDNLGALFTHAGQSETIYSTSTVDTAQPGTTTIDYWAALPATDPTQWLHTTRDVVVAGAANDIPPPPEAASDNDQAGTTETTASSTPQ